MGSQTPPQLAMQRRCTTNAYFTEESSAYARETSLNPQVASATGVGAPTRGNLGRGCRARVRYRLRVACSCSCSCSCSSRSLSRTRRSERARRESLPRRVGLRAARAARRRHPRYGLRAGRRREDDCGWRGCSSRHLPIDAKQAPHRRRSDRRVRRRSQEVRRAPAIQRMTRYLARRRVPRRHRATGDETRRYHDRGEPRDRRPARVRASRGRA
jgi:hypothetical protein